MENILILKQILDNENISLRKFSEKTGLSYNYCSEIVRGDKFPRPDTLIKIATALDRDLKDLFKSTKEISTNDIVRDIEQKVQLLKEKL